MAVCIYSLSLSLSSLCEAHHYYYYYYYIHFLHSLIIRVVVGWCVGRDDHVGKKFRAKKR